jgi:hypothetical protein
VQLVDAKGDEGALCVAVHAKGVLAAAGCDGVVYLLQ